MDLATLLSSSEEVDLSDVEEEAAPGRSGEAEAGEAEEGELPPDEQPPQHGAARDGPVTPGGGVYSAKVRRAAQQLASALREKKVSQRDMRPVGGLPCSEHPLQVHVLLALCARFGVPLARQVLAQTLEAEQAGGVATADGSRRRERGGAFLSLFRASVSADAWRLHLLELKRIEKLRRQDRQPSGHQHAAGPAKDVS